MASAPSTGPWAPAAQHRPRMRPGAGFPTKEPSGDVVGGPSCCCVMCHPASACRFLCYVTPNPQLLGLLLSVNTWGCRAGSFRCDNIRANMTGTREHTVPTRTRGSTRRGHCPRHSAQESRLASLRPSPWHPCRSREVPAGSVSAPAPITDRASQESPGRRRPQGTRGCRA